MPLPGLDYSNEIKLKVKIEFIEEKIEKIEKISQNERNIIEKISRIKFQHS